jgi:tetratricopeptide (TPR) repeat protein
MTELNPVYRALRRKKRDYLPQTAPIAAKFEDCRQCFERFCTVVRSNQPSRSTLVEDSYGKFLEWGNDSGALPRTIDHTLRKTSDLSKMTLELLVTLYSILSKGVDKIQTASVSSNDSPNEALSNGLGSGGVESPRGGEVIATSKVPHLVEHIEGIVGCLMKLMPNLCDPFPVDTYSMDSTVNDADSDINLAAALFPTATQTLLIRLGWANWRRRKYLKSLQEKRKPGMPFSEAKTRNLRLVKESPLRDVAIDAFNFQKPGLKAGSPPFRPRLHPSTSWVSVSDAGAPSIDDDVFSKVALTAGESATSVAETDALVKQLTVPRPPIPLEPGQTFLCPYCHDELDIGINITTNSDWEGHVIRDLEPYICTFDGCLRAEKTFGVRDEWFRHELESHRIIRVWVCQLCVREFTTAEAFETHLQRYHDNISGPSQLAGMVSLCMKHSAIHLKEELCPLCSVKLNTRDLKDHIANHLERLALTSVNGDDTSEEDDSDEIASQRFDDNASEGRTKLEILNDFVEEQLGLVPPDKQGPPDKDLDESNLDFVGDSDDESDVGGSQTSSVWKATRNWRIANYLDGKAEKAMRPNDQVRDATASSSGGNFTLRTLTHPKDEDFVGRDGDLATLYKILSVPGRICTLSSVAGMGKTTTAIEYTYRYEQAYSYVFWTQAETRVGCADTFSLIAVALGLAPDGEDQKQLIEQSRDFLETTRNRWLLVFDNVNDWTDIEKYIPVNLAKSQGSVLVTTRMANLEPKTVPSNFFRIILKEMSIEESRSLLIQGLQPGLKHEKIRFHPEYKVAGEIASLARMPLALSHIVGCVKASGWTLAEFLELWNEWRKNSLSARPIDASSNATLEVIWSIGLSDLGTDALKLLKIMAFMDSENIQRELLMNDHSEPGLSFLHLSQIVRCRKMVKDLTSRKLVKLKKQGNQEVFSVHRLLQHRLLQDLDENLQEREVIFKLAFELIRARLPRPSMETSDSLKWNVFKENLPHVLIIQRIYENGVPMITPFVRLAELFRDGGVHLWQRGMMYDGLRLLNSAEAVLDLLECDEEQLRIDIHVASALVIQYFGISHRAESKDRFWKILQIRKKLATALAPGSLTKGDEMTLCNAMADYGNSLLQFNNYQEAEPIYQECHAKYHQSNTENDHHFQCAKFNHHEAHCLMYHKDFEGAIELLQKAVELVSRQTGQPQLTLRYKFDLACIILQSGDIEKSLEMQEQVLRARLSLQGSGKTNYFTLQSYYAVGAAYAHLSRWDQAEHYMRTSLTKFQERADKSFWPEAAVARTELHLSQILRQSSRDSAEAEALATKARSVLSRLLPFDPLNGIAEEDEIALFDHLQPVFGGRFVGLSLLKYVS